MTTRIITIFEFGREERLLGDERGVCLQGQSKFDIDSLPSSLSNIGKSHFGRALQQVVPILLEREIAKLAGGDIVVPWTNVQHLYDKDLEISSWLPPTCPFSLSIESQGSLGDSDRTLSCRFFHGPTQIFCTRVGAFIAHGSKLYCLNQSIFRVISAVEQFNSTDAKDKGSSARLLAEIKSIAAGEQVAFDEYLKRENICAPQQTELGLDFDSAGRLSLFPKFADLDEELCRSVFTRFSEVQDIYDVDTADGGRLRVVLSPELKEVAQRMRKVSHVSGVNRDRIMLEPLSVFEGVSDIDCIDLGQFGPRVKGIGPYVFQPKPYVKAISGRFLDLETSPVFTESATGGKKFEVGITALDGDGDEVKISFRSPVEVKAVLDKVQSALRAKDCVITISDDAGVERIVPVSENLEAGLVELLEQTKPPATRDKNVSNSRKYLLIYENEDELDYSEGSIDSLLPQWSYEPPSNLTSATDGSPFSLKPYQEKGIGWLQNCLTNSIESANSATSKRGVLLADDMGLGKTLQILSFLSWVIEKEICPELSCQTGPYKPILVVAPVILLENWKTEISTYFKGDGAIFYPFDLLYDLRLKSYKVGQTAGREYELGQPILDIQRLRQHRLIITNYDTVKNYQHSFAMIEWSILIVDEAQKIKEPKTAVTWALKSLNALFKVALTGTPVENRLLDLWNISDFFHPGLLGSAKEFTSNYESGVEFLNLEQRRKLGEDLQRKLRYNSENAFVLRRTKTDELKGLPPKHERIVESPVSNEQIALQQQIISEIKKAKHSSKGRHLRAVQRLARLYQHAALETETRLERAGRAYIEQSPKLQSVLSLLEEIKSRNEKVLIFAVYTKMQLILQRAIAEQFKFAPEIINGTVSSAMSSDGSLRRKIIQRFEKKAGFNILILSPEVAGVGLTITAANNVIHYGRWWNPAKEAQATDRVYRLGQKLPVNVFYPISTSPAFTSFDVRLHDLLQRKKDLARDFLIPHDSLEISSEELSEGLDESQQGNRSEKFLRLVGSIDDLDFDTFVSLCAHLSRLDGFVPYSLSPIETLGANLLMYSKDCLRLGFCYFEPENRKTIVSSESIVRAVNYFKQWTRNLNIGIQKVEAVAFISDKPDRTSEAALRNLSVRLVARKELELHLKKHKISLPELNVFTDELIESLDEFANFLRSR